MFLLLIVGSWDHKKLVILSSFHENKLIGWEINMAGDRKNWSVFMEFRNSIPYWYYISI